MKYLRYQYLYYGIYNVINNERLQVIVEFLFFIRDKTIDIIHLLNKTAPLFFEFLKPGLNNEQGTDSEKNKIDEIKSDDEEYNEDEDLELLQMEFNSNIEGNKMKNEEIFNKSSASSLNEIKCISVLEYISNFKPSNDYSSELKYLFEKIVLPERKTKVEINNIEDEGEEINYYEVLQKKIESIYQRLEDKFKFDPLYNSIIQYFENLLKAKKRNKIIKAPAEIEFYEKYVDNFCDFKNLYIMKMEINDYLKLIDSQEKILKKMEIVKEKYKKIF